jgi:hypothetical protein
MDNTLLLTWTLFPDSNVKNKTKIDLNPEYRKKDYLRAILHYITQSNFTDIVFCENSNADLAEFENIKIIAKIFNKNLEILTFTWNSKIALEYWYWAWEAEIFDYAFANSKILSKSICFYKITWRYILKDINIILDLLKDSQNYFHKQWLFMTQFTVSTAFFKISNQNYKKYLFWKQIELFSLISNLDYNKEIYYKNQFPLERLWYILLRNELLKISQNFSSPIYYEYPNINSHWFNLNFRNLIYKIYCMLKLNQYWFMHKLIDISYFNIKYKKLIKDNLI